MGIKFSNFGKAIVSSAPTGTTGLSFTVEAGKGLLFPALGTGDYFYGIFKDASGNREVVKIDARSTDSLTIATGGRGIDGTTARTWAAGDYFVAGMVNVALQESLGNANLTAIANLTSVADKLPYFTGSGTASTTTFTAAARALLDDIDAAAMRTTIGAVGVAGNETIDGNKTFSGTTTLSTALAVSSGGTGASSASTARTNLGLAYGPTFSAYANADQAVVSGTQTRVTLGAEEFDTASCFTASRFTPNVAGYYSVTGSVRGSSATLTAVAALIAKNGGTIRAGDVIVISTVNTAMQGSVTAVVPMNGTTDYLELWGIVGGGSPFFDYNGGANSTSYFCGHYLRPL